MSSLLRSCKFVRFLAGITRNISGNGRQDGYDFRVNHNPSVYRGLAIRALATQQNINIRQESSLDRNLRRLDGDARRAGRVSRRELDEILDEIRNAKSATSSQSLMVIRCCGSLVPEEHPKVRTKLVQEIWNTLESLGVPMDISHYNALLRVYLENGHQFSPANFLLKLEKKGVEPNRVTYQRLVAQHCQEGDMDGAAKVLQTMRDKQMPVNESVFNSLISGHAFNGDMESARGILGVMKQAGLEPTADTYTALLSGHAKQGDIEAIRAVIAECEGLEIELLDRDLSEIIFALAKADQVEHIPEISGLFKKSQGFNQEIIKLILRLVNIGHEDVGRKILDLLPQNVRQGPDGPETLPTGAFFIKQLIKSGRPTEKIVAICEEMQSSGIHKAALMTALEMSLLHGSSATAFALMGKVKEMGQPLRQHFFWPLLVAESKKKNPQEGFCHVLIEMQKLDVNPRGDTIRDYILDHLKGSHMDKLQFLRSCGVSQGSASLTVAIGLLDNLKLEDAADLVSKSRSNYLSDVIRRPLTRSFMATKNVDAFLTVVQCTTTNYTTTEEEASETSKNSDESVSSLILDVVKSLQGDKGAIVEQILKGLVERGLSITARAAETIQEQLGAELTPEISNLLTTLASGSLEPQPLAAGEDSFNSSLPLANMEMLYESLKARGMATRLLRRNLLIRYCRKKDLEKAEAIKSSLDDENFVYTSGMLVLLMDLYSHSDKLEEAMAMKKLIAEREPEFKIDAAKLIKLAYVNAKSGKFEDALNFIKEAENTALEQSKDARTDFILQNNCLQLLNYFVEQKDEEKVETILNKLIEYKVVPATNVLFGPLMKMKIDQDDLNGALEKFKWCCEQHHCTPWKSEITRRLIESKDAAGLQKLTDLSTQVHGEVNSLYDLVFAFVECGRIKQARKILETPGLRARTFRMDNACGRYQDSGNASPLEGLLEATKDLHNIDRSNIFLHLLKLHCQNEESDKALSLWTQAQDENVQCSDEFLRTLGNYLKEKNIDVPFIIPETIQEEALPPKKLRTHPVRETKEKPAVASNERTSNVDPQMQELKNTLRRNDIDKALEIKDSLNSKNRVLSVRDSSQLIENLINANRVGEAFKVTTEMLANNMMPLSRVFRYMLNKLASIGDIDGIVEVGKHLTEEQKKIISYENRLCNAYLSANKAGEYINQIQSAFENAKSDEEIAELAARFPKGTVIGILEKCPELTDQIGDVSKRFAEKGHVAPYNVLWMHFYANGRLEEANKIWTEHLSKSNRIMFQHICRTSRTRSDPILCSNLLGLLITTENVSAGAKGNVLSCLLDVLTSKNQFDEALISLQAAQKDVGLELVNSTALTRLKTGLESQGKVFPFTIPSKSANQATTTSSSDDD